MSACDDVGFNLCALQALESGLELLIAAPVSPSIRGNEKVMGLEPDDLANLFTVVERGHYLTDAVNQHIAVMDGRKAIARGRHTQDGIAVSVCPLVEIRFCGHAKDRVFHRGHVPLGGSIENVAHEKILLRVAIRQERGAVIMIRVITHQQGLTCYHPPAQGLSCYHTPTPRYFARQATCYHPPINVLLHTG